MSGAETSLLFEKILLTCSKGDSVLREILDFYSMAGGWIIGLGADAWGFMHKRCCQGKCCGWEVPTGVMMGGGQGLKVHPVLARGTADEGFGETQSLNPAPPPLLAQAGQLASLCLPFLVCGNNNLNTLV